MENSDPAYINPRNGKIRCPINGFKDCVKDRCMFWRRARDSRAVLAAWRYPGADEMEVSDEDFTCQLLTVATILPVILTALACMPQPIFGESATSSVTVPDLSAHRLLRELSEKIDQLLKRTEKA